MRILLSFATRIEWHEGHQIARALATIGHDVRVVDVTDDPAGLPPHVEGFPSDVRLDDVCAGVAPDLYLYIEPRGLLPRGLERADCRTACILSDTALSLHPRIDLSQLFDDVLVYHRDAVHAFPAHRRSRVQWMPVALDPTIFFDRLENRDLDVAFSGARDGIWSDRAPMLAALQRRYRVNDVDRFHSTPEIAALYNQARIVFNAPVADYVNPRVFEAMGCGALLVTQRCSNGIETLLNEGEHMVQFDNAGDLMAKIDYYLAHDSERAAIAAAGRDEVHRRHTYVTRMTGALDRIVQLPAQVAPARELSSAAVRDIYERRHKQAGESAALFRAAAAQSLLSAGRWQSLGRGAATFARHWSGRIRNGAA